MGVGRRSKGACSRERLPTTAALALEGDIDPSPRADGLLQAAPERAERTVVRVSHQGQRPPKRWRQRDFEYVPIERKRLLGKTHSDNSWPETERMAAILDGANPEQIDE